MSNLIIQKKRVYIYIERESNFNSFSQYSLYIFTFFLEFIASIASLIPTCKYTDDTGLVSKSEDVACAVCLNEFKDGEEVKVLPELMCIHFMFLVSICSYSLTRIGPASGSQRQPTITQNPTHFGCRILVNHSEQLDLVSKLPASIS